MREKTLLIMAAGMGSRFGGLKQIEPVGPNGEFLIDYSVYDAIRAGFTKVIFVIKRENEQIFKSTIGNRIADHIKVEYAFQDLEDLPKGFSKPEERKKPWGTAHAILMAKDRIHEPFAIINADDFYGYDAYKVISSFLDKKLTDTYCSIGYLVENTLSSNGAVKRAVFQMDEGYVTALIESNVERKGEEIIASPLDGGEPFSIEEDTLVSMNMFGFSNTLFSYIEKDFPKFLQENLENFNAEYLIPDVVFDMIRKNKTKVEVLPTNSKWQGITYREDKELVVDAIKLMIQNHEYPQNLWAKKSMQ